MNSAVAREVRAELEPQELKPKALTFGLGVGDEKASALYNGEAIWTMAELEGVTEGVDLSEMVMRCAANLPKK